MDNNLIKEREEIDDSFKWDLTPLYESDEAFEEALAAMNSKLDHILSFDSKLVDAKTIREFYDESTCLEQELSNLYVYASLRKSEDTRKEDAQSMYQRIYGSYVNFAAALSFADPQILSLEQDKLDQILNSAEMEPYKYRFSKLVRQKAHVLTEEGEKVLAMMAEALAAPSEVASNLMNADMTFENVKNSAGEELALSGANYILLQSSQDRTLRKNSFKAYYKAYKDHINTFAAAYAGKVKAAVAEAKLRGYESSLDMYTSLENVPSTVYDSLIDAVHKCMPYMHRYVKLRKKILGLDELHYYDVYAPLVLGDEDKYSLEEAEELVLAAVEPLGQSYVKQVKTGFENRWMDVYPNKGKRSGAFSEGTYSSIPYVLTNFVGNLDSVSTIAHEFGHSMHTFISNHKQEPQNAEYTIFVAEVASTVNENLLIEKLLADCKDKKKELFLLNHYLEGFKGTVYRQAMFAEFEQKAHQMAESGQALNATSLSKLYRELIELYFGEELIIDDEVDLEWARIPHFYTPFYVYKYATGYSSAVAISENILKKKDNALDAYLSFLSTGGSMDPLDELKIAGLDLSDSKTVIRALEKFDKVLDRVEELSNEGCI